MNSKIKVDKFVIVVFLLCMVCNMTMQAKAYESFKVSIYVRAYEVDKMKDIHWLDSTWTVISQQLEVDKIYLETHRDLLVVEDATLEQAKKFFHDRGIETAGGITETPFLERCSGDHHICPHQGAGEGLRSGSGGG